MGILSNIRHNLIKVERDIKGIRDDLMKHEAEEEVLKEKALRRLHKLEHELDVKYSMEGGGELNV